MPYLFFLIVLADVCALIDVVPPLPLFGAVKALFYCVGLLLVKRLSDKRIWGFLPLKKLLLFFFWSVLIAYLFLSLLNVCGYAFYGMGVTRRMFTIFQQTSFSELSQFLPSIISHVFTLKVLGYVAAGLVLVFVFGYLSKLLFFKNAKLLGLIASVWIGAGFQQLLGKVIEAENGRNNYFMLWRAGKAYVDMVEGQQRASELFAQNKQLPYAQTVKTTDIADNVILILGESQDVRHCSSFGYSLPTNQYTKPFQTDAGFLFFTDVITPYCSTEETVSRLFTFMDDRPESDCEHWADFPSIVAVMKAAGYKCFWLSNQQRLGKFMDCATPIAELSDSTIWLREYESDVVLNQYDDALLPHLKNVLSDSAPKKFIVMHLYGAHPSYEKRYPLSRKLFTVDDVPSTSLAKSNKEKQFVAHYDNAIAFSDSVVAVALNIAKNEDRRTALIYLSDHGQNVYDSEPAFGHHSSHVNVPMYVYCNNAYRIANSELFDVISGHCYSPVSSAYLIHSILGLSGVVYNDYCASLDLTSAMYQLPVRYSNQKIYDNKSPAQ